MILCTLRQQLYPNLAIKRLSFKSLSDIIERCDYFFRQKGSPIIVRRMSPFLICGCERFSVRIRLAFLTRFDLPSTCPTSDNPLGVISLSLLTTYSISRIFKFTIRVLFVQRFLCFYFTSFTLFCTVVGRFSFAESGEHTSAI